MKSRSGRLVVLFMVLLGAGTVGARAAEHQQVQARPGAGATSKVRVPKGAIDEVTLSRNPDTGDVLVVYEADGRIYATVLKPTAKAGKYRGRKAKRISGPRRINHRPSAMWDPSRGTWAVVWDTGPADPATAWAAHLSGATPLSSSEIHARELRARTGKPIGAEAVLDAGNLAIGAKLLLPEEAAAAAHAPMPGPIVDFTEAATDAAAETCKLNAVDLVDLYLARIDALDRMEIPNTAGRLVYIGEPVRVPGASPVFIPADTFGSNGGTATLLRVDDSGIVRGYVTPDQFPAVDTRGPGFVPFRGPQPGDPFGHFFWHENAQAWWNQVDNAARVLRGPAQSPCRVETAVISDPFNPDPFAAHPGGRGQWVVGWDPVDIAPPRRDQAGAEARLYIIDAEGNFGDGQLLARSRRGILDVYSMSDVGDDGRLLLLWAETRNKKRSKLWLESVVPVDE